MQELRASVGEVIAELVEAGVWGWGGGFSENRNASEDRTDIEEEDCRELGRGGHCEVVWVERHRLKGTGGYF